jgi:hypothetical protein
MKREKSSQPRKIENLSLRHSTLLKLANNLFCLSNSHHIANIDDGKAMLKLGAATDPIPTLLAASCFRACTFVHL